LPHTNLPQSTRHTFTNDGSLAFATLSGDCNPIHVDPEYARRSVAGRQVVHGLHLVFAALEAALSRRSAPVELLRIDAKFLKPVTVDSTVLLTLETDGSTVHAELRSEDILRCRVSFLLGNRSADNLAPRPDLFAPPAHETCQVVPAELLSNCHGEMPLTLDNAELVQQFPAVAKRLSNRTSALLLSLTRLVGMRCPGRDSLFVGFQLTNTETDCSDPAPLHYAVTDHEIRFRKLTLSVHSAGFRGTLDVLNRPPPVKQISLSDAKACTGPGEFSGIQALIIGGSRGLGEATLKLICAGGGSAAISYRHGQRDAQALSTECSCQTLAHDVHDPRDSKLPEGFVPNLVFYFASPPIKSSFPGRWDQKTFDDYLSFYVTGLAQTVAWLGTQLHQAQKVTLWVPSTIFIDQPDRHFKEYAAAKAAAESYCRFLSDFPPKHLQSVHYPRLPRIRTDQTAGYTGPDIYNAEHVLLAELRKIKNAPQGAFGQ